MEPTSMAVLGIGLLGAASSLASGVGAAEMKRGATEEAVRRLRLQHARTIGQAKLAGASSGVELESGSTQTYINAMTSEFRREASWMESAGATEASAISTSAGFNFVSDIGSSLFQFGKANNWFKTPTVE